MQWRYHWPLRTLERVLDDGDDALKLFGGEVTGTLVEIDIGLLADQVGVTATDTSDLGQGVHDLLLAIDVRVQQTDDVLEAVQVSIALTVRKRVEVDVAHMCVRDSILTATSYRNPPVQSS